MKVWEIEINGEKKRVKAKTAIEALNKIAENRDINEKLMKIKIRVVG